jgi:hypothetical protein
MRRGALALSALVAACGARSSPSHDGPATPPAPLEINPGNGPLHNPLNLYDVMIEGSPDYETVGAVGDTKVTTRELDQQSIGAFGRIGHVMFEARERGWRWQIERTGLERSAQAAAMALEPFLRREYSALPSVSDRDLDRFAAAVDDSLAGVERRRAKRSLWRWQQWQARRSQLVGAGLRGVTYERIRYLIIRPEWGEGATVEATIGDRKLSRLEMRRLAGWQEELARDEYYRVAKLQFDQLATQRLLDGEAARRKLDLDKMIQAEVAKRPPIRDAEVRAYIRAYPQYATGAEGYERAKDNVRRQREADAREAILARARAARPAVFYLRPPTPPPSALDVPWPRRHGDANRRDVLVVFHGIGCPDCMRGSLLIHELVASFGDRLQVIAGDYFSPMTLTSYRAALALRCADEQGDWWKLFEQLGGYAGAGAIDELARLAGSAGVDSQRFTRCMEDDRFLPAIAEDLAMAERIGLEQNVPGLFVDGTRLGRLGKTDLVKAQVEAALQHHP